MFLRTMHQAVLGLSFLACSSVFAAPLTVDVTGAQSYSVFGDPGNQVWTFNVGANAMVTGLSYNVNVTAYDPSYLSELSLAISDSTGTAGILFIPGFADDFSGTASYVGQGSTAFSVGADGILRFEFYEEFDDLEVAPDGMWNFGTVTISFAGDAVDPGTGVPEPGSILLFGAGLGMMAYAARRRRGV